MAPEIASAQNRERGPGDGAQPPLKVALIGNPNVGKSTLFTALTGVHAVTGNFPGVTVEKKVGFFEVGGRKIELLDLPGTYSLTPRTPDEQITVSVLLGMQADVGPVDAIVCIADMTHLERHLYLVSQVLELNRPVVLVLNMADRAAARQVTVDARALAEALGIPVVLCSANRSDSARAVGPAILAAKTALPLALVALPASISSVVQSICSQASPSPHAGTLPFKVLRLLFEPTASTPERAQQFGVSNLVPAIEAGRTQIVAAGVRLSTIEAKSRFAWARQLLAGRETRPAERVTTRSDRADKILTNRWVGPIIFVALMLVVFQSIFTFATPLMELFKAGPQWVGEFVTSVMPPGALRSLLVDGAIAGVGSVVVFVPQIAILFLFIAILEDCGYLARAAFLSDRILRSLTGLSGKSFVPLMSSFACAIPGIMATRVIENRRDRLITILIAPLMSCSARLPVYVLLINAFVPAVYLAGWLSVQGMVLAGAMSLGAIVAVPVAWLLRKTMVKADPTPFVLELPSYKWPSLSVVVRRVYEQCKAFLTGAGTLIFLMSVIIWGLGYFPGNHAEADRLAAQIESLEQNTDGSDLRGQLNAEKSRLLEASFMGQLGHFIEPAVKPLGWDWRIGVGVIASFPAREVMVAMLGTIYSLGGDLAEDDAGLTDTIRAARWPDGRPVFNLPVALSVIVFFALCAQCASTLMVIRRETQGWGWPLFTFAYMTLLAYAGAWVTVQIGLKIVGSAVAIT